MESFNGTSEAEFNSTGLGARPKPNLPGSMIGLYFSKLVGFPILFFFIALGVLIACLTIRRTNIKKHSSAFYLLAMILADFVTICTWWLISLLRTVYPGLTLNDGLCTFIVAMAFTSRIGSCAIVIALTLERVLLLSNPKRFSRLAMPQVAIIISCICVVLALLLGGYIYDGITWHPQRGCIHTVELKLKSRSTSQNGLRMAATFAGVSLLFALNIFLGVLLYQRKKNAVSDPIQNSIAHARKQSTQLNRINFICFGMSLVTLITNLPSMVLMIVYWQGILTTLSLEQQAQIWTSLEFLSVLMISIKSYLIGVISPKIRHEAQQALACSKGSHVTRQVMKQVKPKAAQEMAASLGYNKTDMGNGEEIRGDQSGENLPQSSL